MDEKTPKENSGNEELGFGTGKALFSFEAIRQRMPKLLGETLTVLDASIHEPIARKAAKDLVKKSFYGWMLGLDRDAAFLDPQGHGRSGGSLNLEEDTA